jgi:hypothetical protein
MKLNELLVENNNGNMRLSEFDYSKLDGKTFTGDVAEITLKRVKPKASDVIARFTITGALNTNADYGYEAPSYDSPGDSGMFSEDVDSDITGYIELCDQSEGEWFWWGELKWDINNNGFVLGDDGTLGNFNDEYDYNHNNPIQFLNDGLVGEMDAVLESALEGVDWDEYMEDKYSYDGP